MFIFYNPETLRVDHVVTYAPPDYSKFLSRMGDQHWVETNEEFKMEEIEILPDRTLRRRVPMSLEAPSSLRVGVSSMITGVPEGAKVFVNGTLQGVMDSSEVLDFTLETGGQYHFRFECSGYITKEITLEAIP